MKKESDLSFPSLQYFNNMKAPMGCKTMFAPRYLRSAVPGHVLASIAVDAASAAQSILPSVRPDSNRRSRQGLGVELGRLRGKNLLPTR